MLSGKQYETKKALAILFACLGALVVASFFLGVGAAEITIDEPNPSPPSSTAALGILLIILIPIYIGCGALVGGAFGFILGLVTSRVSKLKMIPLRKTVSCGIVIGVAISVFAASTGYTLAKKFIESDNIVGLIYTDGQISKRTVSESPFTKDTNIQAAKLDYDKPASLSVGSVTLDISDRQIHIINSEGNTVAKTTFYFYSYITEVQAIEVNLFPDEKSCVAILATLRATSRRAMLLIYSSDGKLLYKEMLEKQRGYNTFSMYTVKLPATALEKLVIENKDTFIYSSQEY
ncbi:MAG: hypothetical protein ACYSSO_04285 [Planctomycetota bacterium]|jgi:hypothetical protein